MTKDAPHFRVLLAGAAGFEGATVAQLQSFLTLQAGIGGERAVARAADIAQIFDHRDEQGRVFGDEDGEVPLPLGPFEVGRGDPPFAIARLVAVDENVAAIELGEGKGIGIHLLGSQVLPQGFGGVVAEFARDKGIEVAVLPFDAIEGRLGGRGHVGGNQAIGNGTATARLIGHLAAVGVHIKNRWRWKR